MGLLLNKGETELRFSVDKKGFTNHEDCNDFSCNDFWVVTSVSVKNRHFCYSLTDSVFVYNDLIYIRDNFIKLLAGQIHEKEEIGFIEPDYSFIFYPPLKYTEKLVNYNGEERICKEYPALTPSEQWRVGENKDIVCEFIIALTTTSNVYPGDRYVILLHEEDIVAWRDYLNDMIDKFDMSKRVK